MGERLVSVSKTGAFCTSVWYNVSIVVRDRNVLCRWKSRELPVGVSQGWSEMMNPENYPDTAHYGSWLAG